jgi:hypothetical protein
MLRLTILRLCGTKKTCIKKAIACVSLMLLLALSLTPYAVSPMVNAQIPQQQQVTVGIAGDHGNGSELERTIRNMEDHGVELALLPGDFSYGPCSSVDSWWSKWQSLSAQKYGALGNHDTGCRDQYLSKFKSSTGPGQPQDSWVYSRDWNGIHFISLNTEDGSGASSEQQNFVRNDLQQASQNPNVKWIFVMFHKQMKSSSASPRHAAIPALWPAYSALFSQYGVDLVLQAHMHNYERLKPSGFQRAECSNFSDFPESCGPTYSVIGTGGISLYNFEEIHPESLVRYVGHGYLNLDIVNNGNTLKGSFFGNDGSVRDTFTITKSGTTPQPTPAPIPQPGPSTIDQQRALQFIKNSYNSQVGLLREAPCCNVYWLWNDNLLGQMALKHIDPELAAQVEAKMNSFDVPMRTPWATLDPQYRNFFSVRGSSEPTISTSPFVIRYSDYGGSNTLYCNNYADIAFLSAIHYFYLGNNEMARMCYDAGKSTWDGVGMDDAGSITGEYAVYKTALGLLAQKVTGSAPIGIPSDYFNRFQASNGGITTDIIGGRPAGSQNIETTVAVLFALNPHLLQEPTPVPIPSPEPTPIPMPTDCMTPEIEAIGATGNDGNLPQNTLDNNANTRWSNFGLPSSIQYDLDASQLICDVDIAWYRGNLRVNTFTISASNDGQAFQTIFNGQSSGRTTAAERYDIADVTAKYLRITVTENTENSWASITEVDINNGQNLTPS